MTPQESKALIEAELGWDDDRPLTSQSSAGAGREITIRQPAQELRQAISTIDRSRVRYPLERAQVRIPLIHELAKGELTQAELSRILGVEQSSVFHFRQKFAEQILMQQQNMADSLTTSWIASKANRIASYQDTVDRIDDELDGIRQPESQPADLMRIKGTYLKNVAEEMGHLPSKTTVNVTSQQRT